MLSYFIIHRRPLMNHVFLSLKVSWKSQVKPHMPLSEEVTFPTTVPWEIRALPTSPQIKFFSSILLLLDIFQYIELFTTPA